MEEAPVSYRFTYDSKSSDIDLRTLLSTQSDLEALFEGMKDLLDPEISMHIRVRPPQRGSFEMELLFVVAAASASLLNTHVSPVEIATTVVKYAVDFLKLRKVLGGENPKRVEMQGGSVQIYAADSATVTVNQNVYHYYQTNPSTNEAVTDAFVVLDDDKDIAGVALEGPGIRKTVFKRSDFERIAALPPVKQEPDSDKYRTMALVIEKPSFDDGMRLKWRFIFNGTRLHARIVDKEFKKRVEDGLRFGKGDTLKVRVRITRCYDKELGSVIEKGYVVEKVLSIERRAAQSRMDL
jgi:hypothetical protein